MKDKKYIALYKNIKDKITRGEYKSGEKLPSKRVMANMCTYSLITVENAYRMLADEGYIKSVEKSGYFVQDTVFPAASSNEKETRRLTLLSENVTNTIGKSSFSGQGRWKHRGRVIGK